MSTCSDDCICCCLPCIVCWGCIYYSYVGITKSCKWCYRKCRGLEDEDDEDANRHSQRAHSSKHPGLNSAGPSSPSHTKRTMESMDKRPVSLKVPPAAYPNSSIRTQPLPVEKMVLTLPSRSTPSASSGSRDGSPKSNSYSYSDRYRPHNRSSLASTSFTADLASHSGVQQTESSHDQAEIPPSFQHKKYLVPLVQDMSDGKDPITLEPRQPHELREAEQKYGHPRPHL